MTPQEINRAIAEVLDYTVMQDESGGGWKLCHPTGAARYPWRDSKEEAWADCDEYVICLNACSEFERYLDGDDKGLYASHLFDLVPHDENHGPAVEGGDDIMLPSSFSMVTATAPQRCNAFLLTVGKWKESAR